MNDRTRTGFQLLMQRLQRCHLIYFSFDKDDTTSTNTQSQETALKAVPTDGLMHTYGVDWKGAKVAFYFDGKSVATANVSLPPMFTNPYITSQHTHTHNTLP